MRRLCGPLSDCLRRAGLLFLAVLLLGFAASLAAQSPAHADILKAHDFLVAGDAVRTRIVMQLDDNASLNWFLLRSPHRLVVDLPQTSFAIAPADLKPRGLVTNVRYGKISDDHSRMIFAVNGPFTVDGISIVKNESAPGYRFVADIVASPEADFEAALAKQAGGAPKAAAATDEPVDANADEAFDIYFLPEPTSESSDEEVELQESDCDVVFHDGSAIDLGEAIADTLALTLDPYPRSAGAEAVLREAGVLSEGEAGPFAALAKLKAAKE